MNFFTGPFLTAFGKNQAGVVIPRPLARFRKKSGNRGNAGMPVYLEIISGILGLVLIFYAMNRITESYFVESLEAIAGRLRLTSDIAGASLMAIGSSAPELFISLLALVKGMEFAELGAGTIVGSALFNILVIIGATALLGTTVLNWQPAVRDILFYALSIALLYYVIFDGEITLSESFLFIGLYLVYLAALPLWRRTFPYEDQAAGGAAVILAEEFKEVSAMPWYWWWTLPIDVLFKAIMPDLNRRPNLYWWTFLISVLVISLLSWGLVEAGVMLATAFGVPNAIIGLTVLAVGTSVPDLLSSLIVARQGKGDMAVSNAIGSNIFDILVGLGVVWMVIILANDRTIAITPSELNASLALLMGSVVLLIGLLLSLRWRIGKRSGFALIAIYSVYILVTIGSL